MPKYSILRLTFKINMDDTKEKSFARAMLRRLNILFVKCKPRNALATILNDSKVSDAYEGSQKIGETKTPVERKVVHFQIVKPIEKILPEQIVERSMEPPVLEAEIVEG